MRKTARALAVQGAEADLTEQHGVPGPSSSTWHTAVLGRLFLVHGRNSGLLAQTTNANLRNGGRGSG